MQFLMPIEREREDEDEQGEFWLDVTVIVKPGFPGSFTGGPDTWAQDDPDEVEVVATLDGVDVTSWLTEDEIETAIEIDRDLAMNDNGEGD